MLTFPGWFDQQLGTMTAPTLVLVADRDVVRPGHAVRMVRAIEAALPAGPRSAGPFRRGGPACVEYTGKVT
jgi:hypothetical protein